MIKDMMMMMMMMMRMRMMIVGIVFGPVAGICCAVCYHGNSTRKRLQLRGVHWNDGIILLNLPRGSIVHWGAGQGLLSLLPLVLLLSLFLFSTSVS